MENKRKNIFDLNGQIAVVTGGYGHLGKVIVKTLYQNKAKVIVLGRSKEKYLSAFNANERKRIFFHYVDILDSESISLGFDELLKKYKKIDILVNNAQFTQGQSQSNLSDTDWTITLDGVLLSVYKTISKVIPIMVANEYGKIINVASMYGIVSPDFDRLYSGENCEKYLNPPHYGAAKAAVIQLTKYFAVLLGKYNINVNSIAPGPFPKEQIQEENPVFIERLKLKNPLNRIGTPDDLKGTVALLSSSASNFITGQTIQIDGGWTIW